MTARGVPAGATSANQDDTSDPGRTASAVVGTSGSCGSRRVCATASARSVPALICAITDGGLVNMPAACPDSSAVTVSAPLL